MGDDNASELMTKSADRADKRSGVWEQQLVPVVTVVSDPPISMHVEGQRYECN